MNAQDYILLPHTAADSDRCLLDFEVTVLPYLAIYLDLVCDMEGRGLGQCYGSIKDLCRLRLIVHVVCNSISQ